LRSSIECGRLFRNHEAVWYSVYYRRAEDGDGPEGYGMLSQFGDISELIVIPGKTVHHVHRRMLRVEGKLLFLPI
jgi:hypothetical protein